MNGLRQIGDVLDVRGDPRRQPRRADRERAAELAAVDTMLSAVIAARGRKYLMMNAPAGMPRRAPGPPAGPRIADGHPARPRRDDRDPLGRRRGRRLGPAAATQGGRRVRDPRPADREDRPVSADAPADRRSRLRRLDLRAVAAGDPAATARPPRPHPARRRPRSARPRRRPRHPRRRPGPRRRGGPRREPAVGGGRPDGRLVLDADDLRAAATASSHRVRRALDQAIDHVRRFAETQRPTSTRTTIAPGIEIERRWTPLASVGAYVPGGSAPYPSSLVMTVVPARSPGVDRDRRRLARRPRRARRTRSCSAPPACSRSTPSSSPAARRRSVPSRTGSRTPASTRSTGSSVPATPG